MVLAAAIQLEAVVGDVPVNLSASERLADEAGRAGAKIIALPEFFTTGIGFVEALKDAALAPDGEATALLTTLARRHGALVGGSFLCRDPDGHVRNAYIAAGPNGVVGRHDKDLPTMWENSFYVGGADDGVFPNGDYDVGAAVCWELMRTGTVRRMRSRVDLVMTGSGWWSVPQWTPRALFDRWERRNCYDGPRRRGVVRQVCRGTRGARRARRPVGVFDAVAACAVRGSLRGFDPHHRCVRCDRR